MGIAGGRGITGGPNFRVIGEKGALEWNNESPQALKCLWLDQPMQVITRGQGRGVSLEAERCTRRGRGNTEGWVEAWANLYTEFALAVAAHLDQVSVPPAFSLILQWRMGLGASASSTPWLRRTSRVALGRKSEERKGVTWRSLLLR